MTTDAVSVVFDTLHALHHAPVSMTNLGIAEEVVDALASAGWLRDVARGRGDDREGETAMEWVACRSCGKSATACGRSGHFCCMDCSASRFGAHDPVTPDGGDR